MKRQEYICMQRKQKTSTYSTIVSSVSLTVTLDSVIYLAVNGTVTSLLVSSKLHGGEVINDNFHFGVSNPLSFLIGKKKIYIYNLKLHCLMRVLPSGGSWPVLTATWNIAVEQTEEYVMAS